MKEVALFVAVLLHFLARSAHSLQHTYYPNEYILMEDKKGTIYNVSLKEKVEETRALPIDINVYVYTRRNYNDPVLIHARNASSLNCNIFNPNRKTVFLIHGWKDNYTGDANNIITPAILKADNVNMFVVDWGNIADLSYLRASGYVYSIGSILGAFINDIIKMFEVPPESFALVGFSLGAHIAGCAGATVDGLVDHIVGLDPAGPLFSGGNKNSLGKSNANFVHVIHTNGGTLGLSASIGHADYYPNGGMYQPGCGLDWLGGCAHNRVIQIYAESILTSSFISFHCPSYRSFNKHECAYNHTAKLGELWVDKKAKGDYYLNTAASSPFALGNAFDQK